MNVLTPIFSKASAVYSVAELGNKKSSWLLLPHPLSIKS
jgi:hypothetical protein